MLLRLRTRRWKLWFESSYLIPNSKFQIDKPTDVLYIHDLHVNQLFLYLINVSCVCIIFQQPIQPWFNMSFLQWLKHVPKISYLSRWRCRPTFPSRTWRRRRGTTWTRSWRSCRWLWKVEVVLVDGTSQRIQVSQTTSNTSSNYSPPSPYLWAPRLSHLRLLYAIITLQTQQDLLLLFGKVGKGKKLKLFFEQFLFFPSTA